MLITSVRTRRRSSARRGFSLVEMLIVIVLLAVVLSAVMTIFVQQQRFYSDSAAIMQTRSATRDAASVLQSDLHALSPKSGDIYSMGASFIEFRTQPGSSVVCTIDATRKILTVPPVNVSAESGLTSWLSAPVSSDTVLILDPGSNSSSIDDTWQVYVLTAAPTVAGVCPTTTGLTTTAGEAAAPYTFNIDHALTATTPVGAPIRIVRKAHYELYQEASGNWYLGYYDCIKARVPVCNALAPVAGPYVPPNVGGTGGIVFSFRDSTGAVTATTTLVRRIDLVARAQTAVSLHTAGYARAKMTDSTFASIAPRN
jgi:prepilin-type N-terminal cleavage/methylation domain-containing protein